LRHDGIYLVGECTKAERDEAEKLRDDKYYELQSLLFDISALKSEIEAQTGETLSSDFDFSSAYLITDALKLSADELSDWGKLGKPVMFTEYGADTVSGLHDTTSVMYTEEYQVEYYEMNNKVFDEFEFVVGEQAWNFADFATSQSLLRVQGNKKGLFTRDRKPKMVAHYFRNRWSNIPEFGYKK